MSTYKIHTEFGRQYKNIKIITSFYSTGTFAVDLGSDATGDIYYRSAGGLLTRLPIGGSNKILGISGGLPAWIDAPQSGSSITWSTVTGTSQAGAVNSGYITNNAGLVTVSLPTTAAVGDMFYVVGQGAGGWKITQAASQIIYFGNANTTSGTGGYLQSTNNRDVVQLECIVANTTWQVIDSIGNITMA